MDVKLNPQQSDVYSYMEKHGGITTLEAVEQLGILRLASRINELVKLGIPIEKKRLSYTNKEGKTSHFIQYSLGE